MVNGMQSELVEQTEELESPLLMSDEFAKAAVASDRREKAFVKPMMGNECRKNVDQLTNELYRVEKEWTAGKPS